MFHDVGEIVRDSHFSLMVNMRVVVFFCRWLKSLCGGVGGLITVGILTPRSLVENPKLDGQ